jgi:cytochrome c oxidase subunit 2
VRASSMRTLASTALVLLLSAVALAPAASAGLGMPDALTPRGQTVGALYTMIAWMGIAMFLLVFVWLVVVIWRFREGTGHGKATYEKERHSLKAEVTWVFIPLLMVLWIGYSAYGGLVNLDQGIAVADTKMEVKVEGTQWNWQFQYGDVKLLANPDLHTGNVSAANTFLVPQDTNLLLNITSGDVIHAFQLLDANRAYVVFNDANPLGNNKYTLQTVNLPAGEYLVQCNKMCLNPGHAYMHAAVKAVPQAQFDHWLAGKKAVSGASLLQSIPVTVQNGLLQGMTDQQLAATQRLVLDVQGPHGDLTFDVADQHRALAAGEAVNTFVSLDFPAAGNFTLKVTDTEGAKTTVQSFRIDVVAATVVHVDMANFKFLHGTLDFQAGTTYLIQAENKGESSHDFNIGTYGTNAPVETLVKTDLVGPGATGSVLFTPAKSGTFDIWCNPHASIGMLEHGASHVA